MIHRSEHSGISDVMSVLKIFIENGKRVMLFNGEQDGKPFVTNANRSHHSFVFKKEEEKDWPIGGSLWKRRLKAG